MPEQLVSLIDSITIVQAAVAILTAMAAGLAIMLVPNRKYMMHDDSATEPKRVPLAIGIALILSSVSTGIAAGLLVNKAMDHGLYDMGLPIVPLIEQVRLSPSDQSEEFGRHVEEGGTPTNTIVSMYRLTCPHCEAIYEDLEARLRAMPYDYFWVSSRSPVGEQLRDLYDVTDVPALISFDAKGRASVAMAYTTDAAGNTVLDTAALDLIEHTLQASQEGGEDTPQESGEETSPEQAGAEGADEAQDQQQEPEQDPEEADTPQPEQ